MCGIAGYIGSRKNFPTKFGISDCLKLMQLRRGPDSAGQYIINKENYSFVFLQSRLSIIDPNPRSKQPMEDKDGILSFSGEIYNYLELKSICENKNAKFRTKSDTEVLLKMLNIFGAEALKMLDGDWAFSYYNKNDDKIIISRDRFSVKPLFFLEEKDNFYFASNINHLFSLMGKKKQIDFSKVKSFLTYGFKSMKSESGTFFSEVMNFPGAECLIIKKGFNKKWFSYWNKKIEINNSLNYDDSVESIRENFKQSTKLRLRSDFPIACLLSGGIDSSSVAAIAKKEFNKDLHYFSYKPNNKNYDEDKFIKQNIESLQGKHEYVQLDFKNNISELRKLINDGGVPLNSLSSFTFHRICSEIKKFNYRVLLSGVGGDELFAGNYIDHLNYLVSIYKKPKFKKAYNNWKKNVRPIIRSPILRNFEQYVKNVKKDHYITWHEKSIINSYLNTSLLKKKLKNKKNYSKDFFRNELNKCLFEENVPSHLFSMDQISMYHSIESRYPFLSPKLYEITNSIPSDFLMKKSLSKSIFRDAVKDVVPSKILKSKNKIGFYCDFNDVFKINSKEFHDVIFQNLKLNSLININKFKRLLSKKSIDVPELKLIFNVLNLSLLLESYA